MSGEVEHGCQETSSTTDQRQTKFQPQQTTFEFGPWVITARKSHILQSKCENPRVCDSKGDIASHICAFCRYEKELNLPKIPDMVFADNSLRLQHKDYDCGIEFNSLEALKLVKSNQDSLKVAVADAWREARADSEHIKEVVNPYDWTFTTKYKGTIFGCNNQLKVSHTNEKIDVEKLKRKEKILFYEDIHLFEDELADNGCAFLSVKIRVMPSCLFILERFYLRVDDVLVRIHDTRLYYEIDSNYLLREFCTRESKTSELEKHPFSVIKDPNEVYQYLNLQEEEMEKLEFPN